MEEWRPIPDYLGYEASSLGRIRSRWNILTQWPNEKGYLRVIIRGKHRKVHRLVFAAFNGWWPPETNHKDLDKAHNEPGNLEPSTRLHNMGHARANGAYVPFVPSVAICERCGGEYRARGREGNRPASRFCSRECSNKHLRNSP
jgi:hypothetical protein